MGTTVKVYGEDAVSRAFLEYARDLDREVKEADRRVASQTVEDARGAAYGIGGVAAHVAPSISASGGSVSFGGGLPMAMGAEFGRNAYPQFDGWTGSGEGAGYFLIPTIKRDEDSRFHEYENAADAAARGFYG